MEIRRLLLLAQLPLWLGFGAAYFAIGEAINRRVHIVEQATQTRVQTAQLADVLQLMVDMETGVRGFVLAGHEEFLDPYRTGREQLGGTMAQLYARAERLPFPELARRDLQRIDSLSTRWVAEIAEPEILARRAGRLEAAAEIVRSGRGRRLVDALRERIRLYEAREKRLLREQEMQADALLARLRRTLLVVGSVLLLLNLGIALTLGTLLSRGLEQLLGAIRALGRSGESIRLPEQSITELSELGAGFNQMSADLTRAQAASEQHAADLSQRNVQMRSLGEVSDWLQAARSMEEAAEVLHKALGTLLPGTQGVVLLYNASRNLLTPLTVWGQTDQPAPTSPGGCWALRRGEAQFPGEGRFAPPCLDVALSAEVQAGGYVCFPLFSHGETIGMLRFGAAPGAGVTILDSREELRQLLVPLSRQVGLALSALRLRDRLLEQSRRDPLTGLSNRRHLEEELGQWVARAARGEPLSLLALDVDHFKRLNDTFGHDAGDAVLVKLGQLLRELTPPGGLAARPGGEEFTLLIPAGQAEAVALAEGLRARVEGWAMTYSGIPLGQITVSQGVASWRPGSTPASLTKEADQALYRAKGEGRNRVVRAEAPTRMGDSRH